MRSIIRVEKEFRSIHKGSVGVTFRKAGIMIEGNFELGGEESEESKGAYYKLRCDSCLLQLTSKQARILEGSQRWSLVDKVQEGHCMLLYNHRREGSYRLSCKQTLRMW